MPARILLLLGCACTLGTSLAAQTGFTGSSRDATVAAVEAAIRAGDGERAAQGFDTLVDIRSAATPGLLPDPELNSLYGRLHAAFGDVRVARAYLERSETTNLSDTRRAAAALALAEIQVLVGEVGAAAALLAGLGAATLSPEDRARYLILSARATLPASPARALAHLDGETGWEADWVRGQAHLLRGDLRSARLAADRAWNGAADAPVQSGAVTRVALLRAGLALAEKRRDTQIAMLAAADAATHVVEQRALYLPRCGRSDVRPDDHVTFGVQSDAHARVHLFPVGASRPEVVAPFVDAIRTTTFSQRGALTPGGTLITVRCRTSGVGGIPYHFGADPWASRLASKGIYRSLDISTDDGRLNALAERFDRWKARLGENNPALLGVAIDLSLGLSGRATEGDVEPARVLEAQQRVRALAEALGGADGLMPTDADIEAMRAIATAPNPELRLQRARAHALDMISRAPTETAYALTRTWLDADEKAPASDRLALIQRLIPRMPKEGEDRQLRSLLFGKAEAERELGQYDRARATFAELGVPKNRCTLADTEAHSRKIGVEADDYPDDLVSIGFGGATVFELDLDADGRLLGRRLIYSELGGLFDGAAEAGLPRFVFAPAMRGGKGVACLGHDLRITWRTEDEVEDEEVFPDLTVSPDISST